MVKIPNKRHSNSLSDLLDVKIKEKKIDDDNKINRCFRRMEILVIAKTTMAIQADFGSSFPPKQWYYFISQRAKYVQN